jgi:hypothetical protein
MVGAPYAAPFPNHSVSSSTVSQSTQPPQPDVINPFLWVRKATNPHPIPVSPIDGMSITSSAPIVPPSPTAPVSILSADNRYPYSHPISPSAPLVSHWDPSTHACFLCAALVTSIHDSPHTYTATAKSLVQLLVPVNTRSAIDCLLYDPPFSNTSTAAVVHPSAVIPTANVLPTMLMELDPSPTLMDRLPWQCVSLFPLDLCV